MAAAADSVATSEALPPASGISLEAASDPPATGINTPRPYLEELAAAVQQHAQPQAAAPAEGGNTGDAQPDALAHASDQGGGRRGPVSRTSKFKGVTRHRRSGRWEAHVWIRDTGKQAYLGGYASEEEAAEAHDVAALKCHGLKAKTNFHISRYAQLLGCIHSMGMDELVMAIRRRSQGFTRGSSVYRGVTQHKSAAGRWEVRIGLPGGRHVYLGLHPNEPEAARIYDRALVLLAGPAAATNFPASNYTPEMDLFVKRQQAGGKPPEAKSSRAFEAWLRGQVFREASQQPPGHAAHFNGDAPNVSAVEGQTPLSDQVAALSVPLPLTVPSTTASALISDLAAAAQIPPADSTADEQQLQTQLPEASSAPSQPSFAPQQQQSMQTQLESLQMQMLEQQQMQQCQRQAENGREEQHEIDNQHDLAEGNESEATQSEEEESEAVRPAKRSRTGKGSAAATKLPAGLHGQQIS